MDTLRNFQKSILRILANLRRRSSRYKRDIRFFIQRRRKGWDDSDTWNLNYVIVRFVLPRLKRFREISAAYPYQLTPEEWDTILEKMIIAFQALDEDDGDIDWEMVEEGLDLFRQYFMDLWW